MDRTIRLIFMENFKTIIVLAAWIANSVDHDLASTDGEDTAITIALVRLQSNTQMAE
jgi:hypothetical protein